MQLLHRREADARPGLSGEELLVARNLKLVPGRRVSRLNIPRCNLAQLSLARLNLGKA